jgi:hypothetical protein
VQYCLKNKVSSKYTAGEISWTVTMYYVAMVYPFLGLRESGSWRHFNTYFRNKVQGITSLMLFV